MDAKTVLDDRARALVAELTLDEKIRLVTGYIGLDSDGIATSPDKPFAEDMNRMVKQGELVLAPAGANGTCGYVPGVPRLGIPALHLEGAGVGLANIFGRKDGEAVVFPSALAQTATWNPSLKRAFGQRLAAEALDQGINVLLSAACNLGIDPRSGRNFEYQGEDPLLAGLMAAEEIIGAQQTGVIASIKHFAGNFQETGRFVVNTVVDERSLREGELLVFELAIAKSEVAAVMAAYNLLNGTYACESEYLLTDVLKREWGFDGWVMSDWGAAHSTVESAMAGLDQEFPNAKWFGEELRNAVESGKVPMARLDDMNHRILRQMLRFGLIGADRKAAAGFDLQQSYEVAQAIAEESIVLLTNDGTLPLTGAHRILVVGSHADRGVPTGGGSASVMPRGGNAVAPEQPGHLAPVWVPSSPLAAIRAEFPDAVVTYTDGSDTAALLSAAADADTVLIFAHQPTTEGTDVADLSLPDGQDQLIESVAAVHDRVIVVLETGGAVLTPWHPRVAAVLEAWYPGHRGAEAIAGVLKGRINPSGKLPVTFPATEADLPHDVFQNPDQDSVLSPIELINLTTDNSRRFDAGYPQGLYIGYKWFAEHAKPEFAFGHGLSYTTFDISGLTVEMGERVLAHARIRNSGTVAGAEVVQLYATLPESAGPAPRRLVGWTKVFIEPGAEVEVSITAEPKTLAVWDVAQKAWRRPTGLFRFDIGSSSDRVADGATATA